MALDRRVDVWLAEARTPVSKDYKVLPASSEAFIRLFMLNIVRRWLARRR
jgi:hypothetical protein